MCSKQHRKCEAQCFEANKMKNRRIDFTMIFLMLICSTECFVFDEKNVINVLSSEVTSDGLFGYSVDLMKSEADRDKVWLFSGAPKDRSSGQVCPLSYKKKYKL